MMALCPFWFKLFFGRTHTAKREQELNTHLDKLDDEDRQEVIDYLSQTGQLAMRPVQRWALVFLGSYFLFEVFFISAWVKDMALVWEPKWASALIEWVRANTDFVSDEGVNHQLFAIYFSSKMDVFREMYASERALVFSDFGGAVALFQIFRGACFFIILLALTMVIWRPLEWLGVSGINPQNIHSFRSFMSSSIGTLVITFLSIPIIDYFAMSLSASSKLLLGISYWMDAFFWNFGFVFIIIAIKLICGWIVFWKRVCLHFTH